MDFENFIQIGKTNSKLLKYKNKKQKAIDICKELLLTHNSSYVALSGGKDSVAMAFIVNAAADAVDKDFTLWSHISDASFPGTIETCRSVANMINRKLDIYESTTAFENMNNEQKQKFGKSGVFFDSVREYAKNKDLSFVGVRANESKRRMKAAKAHGMCFYSKSMGNIDVCNPLQWFSIYDVASVLYEYNAPIHPIYKLNPVNSRDINANGEPFFIRLGYITSKDLLDAGTAVFLKYNYPDIYNKLSKIFPEIRNFV